MSTSSPKLDISELREAYPEFLYTDFSWSVEDNRLVVSFEFSALPDISFNPSLSIESINPSQFLNQPRAVIDNLVFNLGLVELISYWKATCSPKIVVKAAPLSAEQLLWWRNLIIDGLGEFFFVNDIDFRDDDFVRIESHPSTPAIKDGAIDEVEKGGEILVLTSGGKDTALTLSLLQSNNERFTNLLLNPTVAASELATTTGGVKQIVVRREIDPLLVELNSKGYLNGHTPFSAYLAFLSELVAVVFGHKYVLVSNERSSNEGNVVFLGRQINHQFSKTFTFEEQFRDYSKTYLSRQVSYFSFLRPLYEIQIAAMLTDFKSVLYKFKSCNRNYKTNSKCGACPKCLAVYIFVFPFLKIDEVAKIFEKKDPFSDPENISMLEELIGLGSHKPFECVGTYEETIIGLFLGLEKALREFEELPPLWSYVQKQHVLDDFGGLEAKARRVLTSWNEQHQIPEPYESILRKAFENNVRSADGIS